MGTWNPFDPDYKWTGFNLSFVDDIQQAAVETIPGLSAIDKIVRYAPLVIIVALAYLVVRR